LCEEKESHSKIPNLLKHPDSKDLYAINRKPNFSALPLSKQNLHTTPTINLK